MQAENSLIGPKIPHNTYHEQKKKNFCSSWEIDHCTDPVLDLKLIHIPMIEASSSPKELPKKSPKSPRRGFLVNRTLTKKKNMITLLPLIKEFILKLKERSDKFKATSMLPYHFKIIQDLTHFDLKDEEEEESNYKFKKSGTVIGD